MTFAIVSNRVENENEFFFFASMKKKKNEKFSQFLNIFEGLSKKFNLQLSCVVALQNALTYFVAESVPEDSRR